MKLSTRTIGLTLAALVTATSFPAFADQADKDACVGLEEDDDCTRGDGSAGTCIPDDSDPGVLSCDDDGSGGSGGDDGSGGSGGDDSKAGISCSTSPGAPAPLSFAFFALAALAVGRRKIWRR